VIDDDVRLAVYERFVADGEPPGVERVAATVGRPVVRGSVVRCRPYGMRGPSTAGW
jgi:hypothetical protein